MFDPIEFIEIEECYNDGFLDGIDAIERDMDLADAFAHIKEERDLGDVFDDDEDLDDEDLDDEDDEDFDEFSDNDLPIYDDEEFVDDDEDLDDIPY